MIDKKAQRLSPVFGVSFLLALLTGGMGLQGTIIAQDEPIIIDLSSLQPITVENAEQLTEIAQLETRQSEMPIGYALLEAALSPDGKTLITRYTDIAAIPSDENDTAHG